MNNIKLGCGGSNPKIITMNKQKIQLEGEDKIFLLLDNNEGFRIIAKCKKLSEELRESILDKYRSNNSGKVKNYTNIVIKEVYIKLISIEYNNEILIIDMNDLKEKEIVSLEYLDNLDLDNLKGIKYNHINISKVKNSPIGLFINGKNIKSYKTIDRIIKIKLKNNDLTIRLAKDKRNLILRNSIEIEYTNFNDLINFSGILLRKDNYYLDKIEELK